ncbi:hypothetical protein [Massilia sp. CF038]|uniref:hypothetical protein n=1 Tax=Massilia sp. CF038 TaxID=1881045 RepID=UPI00093404E1|nr:hypothetical protein [Massilia sp. CF038]
MAYQFAGFLAPSDGEIINSSALPAESLIRRITTPFVGVGIRLPSLVGMTPSADEINALAAATGIAQAKSWLYLAYDTWGNIDSVYALGVQDGKQFGPIDDSNSQTVETTFVDVMARIGVDAKNALQFSPFVRGFWAPQA